MGAVASILCALILLSTGFAHAGEPDPQAFDIRPQSLGSALTAFARQSQQEILFAPELVARKSSSGVRGTMPPLAALKIVLDGSGLSFTSTRNGAILVGAVASSSDAPARPLAAENCRPNLYILVHPKPKELLLAMEKKNFAFTFGSPLVGEEPPLPSVIDRFIATPRAVRVWDISVETNADGLPLGTQERYVSRLSRYSIWTLSHVFVVVDRARLQGITRGQLADYVALVGLADLKPGAKLGDARTILKLFDGAPQSAPAGMSDWDRAFLKSLYSTEQTSKLQRSQIARSMVREIAP